MGSDCHKDLVYRLAFYNGTLGWNTKLKKGLVDKSFIVELILHQYMFHP